jgi:hypothetical protein
MIRQSGSGSSRSARVVDPTMSRKRTETVLRDSCGPAPGPSGAPQLAQKRWVSALGPPQDVRFAGGSRSRSGRQPARFGQRVRASCGVSHGVPPLAGRLTTMRTDEQPMPHRGMSARFFAGRGGMGATEAPGTRPVGTPLLKRGRSVLADAAASLSPSRTLSLNVATLP